MKKPDRYFAFLLRLLPASFRDRHGRELGALLDSMKEDLGPSPSKITLLRLYLAVTWDLLWQSPLSRPEPTPGAHEERRARGVSRKRTPLDGIGLDLKQAIRSLLHAPTYTIVALVTLILGIGANAAIFSVVDAVLFRPRANVQDPEGLVSIYTSDFSGPQFSSSSYPDLVDFIAGAPALEAASGVRSGSGNVEDDRGVTRILLAELVSGNYFDMLGATPFSGRWFTDEEGRWDSGAPVAVIGHGTWSRMFGSDPAILGSQLRISGHSITIVGIAPPSMGSGSIPALLPDLWLPPPTEVLMNGESHFVGRGNRGRVIRARLADGATIETLQAQLDAVAAALASEYPRFWTDVRGETRRVTVTPDMRGMTPEDSVQAALVAALLVSAVVLLLLIACANVATITLVRGSRRHREIAVRGALGASRGRVARHAVVESLLLGAVGGAGGLGLAWLLARVVSGIRFGPPGDSVAVDLSVGPRVLAFSLAVTVLTMIAVGLLPALKAYRVDIAAMRPRSRLETSRTKRGLPMMRTSGDN
ncbi:MAG: ABC transporter permease, partial [Gemmatimonadetes bacterium]|nr:ABC transporter permease [Gemmatimonadota bacterium]